LMNGLTIAVLIGVGVTLVLGSAQLGAVIAAAVYALTHQPVPLITAKKAEQALGSEQVERQN